MPQVGASRIVVVGVLALVVLLMAWDHLVGNQGGDSGEFPVDPVTFVVSLAAVTAVAIVVFGLVVPRSGADVSRSTRAAVVLTVVAVVSAPFLSWLGVPQVIAGGGLISGLRLAQLGRSRTGSIVVGLCCLVLVFGVLATAFAPSAAD